MQCWGLTDPGCVRLQNQDAYQIEKLDRGALLCVICDGMGGAKSGNIASNLACDVFAQEIGGSPQAGVEERSHKYPCSAMYLSEWKGAVESSFSE